MVGYPVMMGIGTSVRGRCYTQSEVLQALRPYLKDNPRTATIFANAGIDTRYLVVGGEYYAQERTTQERNDRYMQESLLMGEEAIIRCLQNAGRTVQDIHDLIVVSCTGIDIPGLDLRLAGRLGMSPHLHRTCVLGMGCYGAFPGLLRAQEAALARPGSAALMLAVEVCSLHFQPGDLSIENIVSSALFADGAAAVLVHVGEDRGPKILDSATFCDYQTFEHMAFHLTDHGFRMSLSAYVPKLLAANIDEFVSGMLERSGLKVKDIDYWGIHPGSSKILDYVQERLELTAEQMDPSRRVLAAYGNMSSATILFVLADIAQAQRPQPGEYGVLLAFGPGLTMEGALVQW